MRERVDYLILGAGWTSTFLIPLLKAQNLSYAATTTTGRDSTIPFRFDPTNTSDVSYFHALPNARNILVSFPLTGPGQSSLLVKAYKRTHVAGAVVRFLQLGSSGIFQLQQQQQQQQQDVWVTRHSAYDSTSPRAVAEDELRALGGCVLNLSGLWGGERDPKGWVDRVATTKEQVRAKMSLHMIHGEDVARAIVAVFAKWAAEEEDEEGKTDGRRREQGSQACVGQRWLLTDGFVYCWWALMAGWAHASGASSDEPSRQSKWVFELMQEEGVRALPRSMEALGRCYDTREFWQTFGLSPVRSRI